MPQAPKLVAQATPPLALAPQALSLAPQAVPAPRLAPQAPASAAQTEPRPPSAAQAVRELLRRGQAAGAVRPTDPALPLFVGG